MNTLQISKETAEKYHQMLEDEKEYVVEKLLAVRECENGEVGIPYKMGMIHQRLSLIHI